MKVKKKQYVCIFQESDGFMYYHYFSTFKKAKKFMKKELRGNNSYDYSLSIIDASICEVIKIYEDRQEVLY